MLRAAVVPHNALLDVGSEFLCAEWGRGWSYPLETGGKVLDAAKFDWERPCQFGDKGDDWRFRFTGSPVRILLDGRGEGLPGWSRCGGCHRSMKVLFVAADSRGSSVSAGAACDGWEELNLCGGLPRGWHAYSAAKARTDEGIRDDYPALALPTNVSISLQGGIRVSRGNRYFDFAPPAVALEGANVERLLFNRIDAGSPNETGQIEIPQNLPELRGEDAGRVLIEAWRGEQLLDRRTIYLTRGGWSWTAAVEGLSLTPFGYPDVDLTEKPSVRGAQVEGFAAPEFDFTSAIPVAEHGSVHYVGRQTGQIVHWPAEPMPEDWSPVWVIVSRRRGQVIFCGTSPAGATPVRGASSDREAEDLEELSLGTPKTIARAHARRAAEVVAEISGDGSRCLTRANGYYILSPQSIHWHGAPSRACSINLMPLSCAREEPGRKPRPTQQDGANSRCPRPL